MYVYMYMYKCMYMRVCMYMYIVVRQITLNGPAGYTCQASYLSYHN